MYRTEPPCGKSAANCFPWMRPISAWLEVTAKTGDFRFAPQLGNIFRRAIQNGPGDSCVARDLRYLRKRASPHWLQNNSGRARFRRGLDRLQNMCALIYGVVVGINHVNVDAQFRARPLRGKRLLQLEIVVVRGKRHQKVSASSSLKQYFYLSAG